MKIAKLSGYSYGLPLFPLFIFSISSSHFSKKFKLKRISPLLIKCSLYSFQFLFSGNLSPPVGNGARKYKDYDLCHKASMSVKF